MEHLPSCGASAPIVIPYICIEMYDGGPFKSYPQRMGWNQDKLLSLEYQGRSSEEREAFLQSWMYFGLLFQVFDVPGADFDPNHFVRLSEDGVKIITTEKLAMYVSDWYEREEHGEGPLNQRQERHRKIDNCFRELDPFVRSYCVLESSSHFQPPKPPILRTDIALAFTMLADAIGQATFHCTKLRCLYNWGSSMLLVHRMTEAGWCESVVDSLTTAGQAQMLYYASTLGPSISPRSHKMCTRHECISDHVNESNYTGSHRPDCSGCLPLGPDLRRIIGILDNGGIPVVSFSKLTEREFAKINVIEHKSGGYADSAKLSYVALSHVWADGLGTQNNTLPACQIKYLQKLVDSLHSTNIGASSKPLLWWCDTLCVPHKHTAKDQWVIAMRKMKQTYQEAEKVLVLDSGLIQNSARAPAIELYIRVKTCGWMRRLWTFQEGKLANALYIQFSDGPKQLIDIYNCMVQERYDGSLICLRYREDCQNTFEPFFRDKDLTWPHRFTGVWRGVMHRASSHRADEVICLATLLGLDPDSLLDIAEEDYEKRIIRLLQLLPTIPGSVLFQRPPRLQEYGFRWSPDSFLTCFSKARRNPSHGSAEHFPLGPEGRGLAVQLPGFKFTCEDGVVLRIGSPISILVKDGSSKILLSATYFAGDEHATNVDGSQELRHPAVICYRSIRVQSAGKLILRAVLVDLHKQIKPGEQLMLGCNFIALLHLTKESLDAGIFTADSIIDKIDQPRSLLKAQLYPEQQNWLVY